MKRNFEIGERVYIPDLTYNGIASLEKGTATPFTIREIVKDTYTDKTTLVKVAYENNGETALFQVKASSLYKLSKGRICGHCGHEICVEHDDEVDYPFYCPECDENMYGIETIV